MCHLFKCREKPSANGKFPGARMIRLHVNSLWRPSLPIHHLETGDGPGDESCETSHLGYRLKAQKAGNFE